ncbi:probable serine/threonine-protein kinase fhkB [Ostrea edulis]|uniref:probable serine/threonine-protein kinase fhkB n=1 Tax=Ostrea edulis TaxID=37623 RepID=UPI0024AF3A04|nr:probable serine/threonine-protein kinase fhkB [Ostrea edulis]
MKFWLSLLLVLAVVSVLEARRGGRRREWRRQRLAGIQAVRRGYPAVVNDDDVKDDDEDDGDKNSWMAKKQNKWAMKRQRKMKRMQKRRGMMAADDSDEDKPEEAQNGDQDKHVMVHRRRWQQHKGNRAQRRQKWRKMKKTKKWMHKRPSCFCLQTEQLEKLQELIKKEGLEKEFPQIMPPEENTLDDGTSDVSDDEDSDDTDDTEEIDNVSEESSESEEVTDDSNEELPLMTTESSIILQ